MPDPPTTLNTDQTQRIKGRSPARRVLAVIAVAALAVAAVRSWHIRPRPLPMISERVADVADWSFPSQRHPHGFGYSWTSDDAILSCTKDYAGQTGDVFELHAHTKNTIIRRDLAYLAALSGLSPGCQFTHDMQYLLLFHIYEKGRTDYTSINEVVELRTHSRLNIVQHLGFHSRWFGEGSRYVEWDGAHKPNAPFSITVTSLRPELSGEDTRTVTSAPLEIGSIYAATPVGDNLVLIGAYQSDELGSVRYVESGKIDINVTTPAITLQRIALPGFCNVRQMAISQDGARVAMLLVQPTLSGINWLKATLFGRYPCVIGPQGSINTLWVCNIDGSNMREVGYSRPRAVTQTDAADEGFSSLDDLRWLPGGRAVSFIGDEVLYRIDVGE